MRYTRTRMRIAAASDSSLCVTFSDTISIDAHYQVVSLFHLLENLHDVRIHNLHPAYASLLIDFDPLSLTHKDLENTIVMSLAAAPSHTTSAPKRIEVRVCYDSEFAPDLDNVANKLSLTTEQVVAMHLGGEYFAYFLGFAPGFAYLGGLDPRLQVPRLASPRKHVTSGSVGIAGAQTGIYPNDSPGGWQLIGRTPLRMFNSSLPSPSFVQVGDQVRFRRIDRGDFDLIWREQHGSDDPRH